MNINKIGCPECAKILIERSGYGISPLQWYEFIGKRARNEYKQMILYEIQNQYNLGKTSGITMGIIKKEIYFGLKS